MDETTQLVVKDALGIGMENKISGPIKVKMAMETALKAKESYADNDTMKAEIDNVVLKILSTLA